MAKGEAIQIVKKSGAKYVLDEKALAGILQSVLCLKVVVVAVAGAFRKGKSFFLSNCLRYLKDKNNWMSPTASVSGFSWQRSTDPVTAGILMWHEPIRMKNVAGEEIAVLLMDTEGAFDHKSSMSQCATVFSLSALLSSLLVYNVPQDVQEDTLNHLQFFTSYGGYALEEGDEKRFQSLLFLIRDWQNDDSYGMDAGNEHLQKKFKTHASSNQSMKTLREDIDRSFTDINCALLPNPGDKICKASEGSGISVSDMDVDFKRELSKLIPQMFTRLSSPKKIGGKQITGSEFLQFFKLYIGIFASGKVPEAKNIYDVNVDGTHQMALDIGLEHYTNTMRTKFGRLSYRQCFASRELQSTHEEAKSAAAKLFKETKKMGSNPRYLAKLNEKIEELFREKFMKDNENLETIERRRKETEAAERRLDEQRRQTSEMLAGRDRENAALKAQIERDSQIRQESSKRKDRDGKFLNFDLESDHHANSDEAKLHLNTKASLYDSSGKTTILGGEAGYTSHVGSSGIDAGVRANATLIGGEIGPVGGRLGVSADTGVRARFGEDWAVGGEVLGTGVTVGRTTKVKFLGSEFSVKWY